MAPTSKTARAWHPSSFNTPLPRKVPKLPGGIHASAKMAPSLHSVVRKALEAKQVQTEDIDTFLSQQKTLARYDSAFRLLCALCVSRGVSPDSANLHQVAGQLLELNKISSSEARNAYSALLMIPGWEQIRFSSLLGPCKRSWNASQPKYSTFLDAWAVLKILSQQTLDWSSVH